MTKDQAGLDVGSSPNLLVGFTNSQLKGTGK